MSLISRKIALLGVASAALVVSGTFGGGGLARAVTGETTCGYVASGPPGVRGNYLQIQQGEMTRTVTVGRSGRRIVVTGSLQLECAGPEATVDNIDRIFFFSDSVRRLRLDMRSGGLGPGASERGRGADIEVFVRVSGTPAAEGAQLTLAAGRAPNIVTFGRAGGTEEFNLNARRERVDDIDLYIESIDYERSFFHTGLGGGDNTVDGRGPARLRPSLLRGSFHLSPGDNRLFGPSAPSHLHTGAGRDVLVGGPDDDSLLSGGRQDRLDGGAGDDYIVPGAGSDRVDAGTGDDRVSARTDDVVDTIDCGPGNDIASAELEDLVRNCETVSRF
jgi:Ca2+-binding RTX toxin-like protein